MSSKPYLCPRGFLTVGYGHKIQNGSQSKCISQNDANTLFLKDLKIAENSVLRNIKVFLLQHQFDSLASFTFNVGGGALQRSTLRQKINREAFEEAKEEFGRWVYCNNKKIQGLVLRRKIEAELFIGAFSTDSIGRYKTQQQNSLGGKPKKLTRT